MNRIDTLFNNMDTWRHYPAYQLERRADIFFSMYLGDVLTSRFDLQIGAVIPEFPVRIGTILPKNDTNNSYKIDYFVIAKDMSDVIFVELKTDVRSRRSKQDRYLQRAKEVGVVELLLGLRQIYAATNLKKKYRCLLIKMQEIGLIILNSNGSFDVIESAFNIRIVYIQPNNNDGHEDVLSFNEVAKTIEKQGDELSLHFAKSLREWASVDAGECQMLL